MIENRRIMGSNIQRHLDKIGMDRKEMSQIINGHFENLTQNLTQK